MRGTGAIALALLVLYDPRGGTTDCGGVKLSYDFRMGNPFARARLGIYAEIPPGPRW